MLAGRPAFPGQTLSDTIAAVLTHEPDWRALPDATPASIRTLLQRCFEKDPRQRLRDIGDARIELDAAMALPADVSREERRDPAHTRIDLAARPCDRGRAGRSGGADGSERPVAASRGASAGQRGPHDGAASARSRRDAGPGMLLSLALSPDGGTLVIAGTDSTGPRLYRRTLDRPEATVIAGTEGALAPFFRPMAPGLATSRTAPQARARRRRRRARYRRRARLSVRRELGERRPHRVRLRLPLASESRQRQRRRAATCDDR